MLFFSWWVGLKIVILVYLFKEPALGLIDLLYQFFRLYFVYFCSDYYFLHSTQLDFFIVLFWVSLSVKLDCLFEVVLVSWGRPVMLWISLAGLLSLCPIDFGLLCSHFHLFQGIIWFILDLIANPFIVQQCYLASMFLCVFQFFSYNWFVVSYHYSQRGWSIWFQYFYIYSDLFCTLACGPS